jgi:copper chaperone
MRRMMLGLVAAMATTTVVAMADGTKTTTLTIKGMSCEGCAATVKRLLKNTEGVTSYDLSLEKAMAEVAYDPEVTDAPTIAQAIVKNGFQVILLPWEPADASFMGCSNGFCGFRTPNAKGIVLQPGAAVGQKVYCPVSGVVLAVKESTLKVEIDGKPVYVCCEGCARYLAANQERVLALRGIHSTARTTITITGLTCGGCAAAVKVQLKRTEGVTSYEVSWEKGEAAVSYDPAKTDPKKIAESISKTGFKARVKDDKAA